MAKKPVTFQDEFRAIGFLLTTTPAKDRIEYQVKRLVERYPDGTVFQFENESIQRAYESVLAQIQAKETAEERREASQALLKQANNYVLTEPYWVDKLFEDMRIDPAGLVAKMHNAAGAHMPFITAHVQNKGSLGDVIAFALSHLDAPDMMNLEGTPTHPRLKEFMDPYKKADQHKSYLRAAETASQVQLK